MSTLRGLTARLRALTRRRNADRQLDDELRFHLEMETEKNVRLGMQSDDARRQALASLGGITQTREAHRAVRGLPWLEELASDVRHALRTLRRNPAIGGAAILTLALGIGANTAIFSAVNAVMLQPLPFAAPDRLYMLWESNPEKGWDRETVAPANMLDWREQVAQFADVAAYAEGLRTTLVRNGDPQTLTVSWVTGTFFSLLDVRATLGRGFTDAETWQTGTSVVVISHRLWRDRFGSDPGIVGRSELFDAQPRQIVGVMPASFAFPSEDIDVWFPMEWPRDARSARWFRQAHWPRAIARLRDGATAEEANAALQVVVRRLQVEYPQTNRVMGAGMTPLHEFLVGNTRRPLQVLLAAVAVLLLIACANVGNLLLVQATGRERETAVRLALGAKSGRLVRQALGESLALSALGGALGLALGWWGTRVLQTLQPMGMLRVSRFDLDWTVTAYVAAITIASAMFFGIGPALWSRRRQPADALRHGGRALGEARHTRRFTHGLVVAEVMLAVVLTLGAGLLVRSLLRLQQVQPGFDPTGVAAISLQLPGTRYDSAAQVIRFWNQLADRVQALPGVEGAAAVTAVPLESVSWTTDFSIAGRPAGEYVSEVMVRSTTEDYARVMRLRLLRGRYFTAADRPGAPPVVVINEAIASKHFRGQEALGQRITLDKNPDSTSQWSTIIGVVANEHQRSLATAPQIEVLLPFAQEPNHGASLLVRTRGEPASLGPSLRRVVAEADPLLAVASFRTLTEVRDASLARERFLAILLTAFAVVGLLLSIVGVYGVMAQLARRRVREMGIRIALGARATQVRWLVVRHALWLVLAGLAGGTLIAFATTRAMRAMLFEVTPVDPLTFSVVPIALALGGLAAAWIPAQQASRAQPAETLREE